MPGTPLASNAEYSSNQALIVVDLPENASLYVNGQRVNRNAGQRKVVTPALKPQKDYSYTIKTTVVRDGKTIEKMKQVHFRAGQTVTVNMNEAARAGEQVLARR